ncbi:MAG TPA: hypothetical protein VGH28_07520 [Polyangiaceae bacterium]
MTRAALLAFAALLLGCSNDTFVSGDASSDAGDGGQQDDASPLPDASPPLDASADGGGCTTKGDAPCASGCGAPTACCVADTGASCVPIATCTGGVELDCASKSDCNGGMCCLSIVSTSAGCPQTIKTGNAQCAPSCGANARQVCKVGSSECGNSSQCVPYLFAIDPTYEIGLCL